MDNFRGGDVVEVSDRPSSFAPAPLLVAAAAAGALLLTVLAALTDDPPGRLLLGVAALGLAGVAATAGLRRPRLAVDADGVAVRGLRRVHRLGWNEVATVEVVTTRRLGRTVRTLEITPRGSDTLLLLTGTDLGADPREVLEVLLAARDRAGPHRR